MFSSLINFILFLILIYLVLYGIYLLTINLKALLGARKTLEEAAKDENAQSFKKLCVVIWANSKSKNLNRLLKLLNEQTYKKENYSTHVVFAKDSSSILYTPDCMSGAQIHCIENPEFFSKDKALNAFLEKLIGDSKFDAYVFLGANRLVNKNYLEEINNALNKIPYDVIVGKTNIVPEFNSKSFKTRILEAKQEFKNNTVNIARRFFDLACTIDSENCVIKNNILEKTGRICFETREDELKYSLFLASNNIKPCYSPYVETFVEAENYNPTTSGLGTRISLFKYYFKLLYRKPWYFTEFVLHTIQPNAALVAILYLTLLYCSFKFITSIGIKYIIHLGIFYLIVWVIGLIASRLNPIKILFFAFYPVYSFVVNFKKITKDISKRAIQRTITEEKNVKSATTDAIVTDGRKDVCCKMDLISEDGMRRVILRFRKKRVISDECIRMYDAIENILRKIKTHGYELKVCQNCAHFKTTPDGTVDLLKGVCLVNSNQSEEENLEEKAPKMLVWNNCDCFIPKKIKSIIENLNNENQ